LSVEAYTSTAYTSTAYTSKAYTSKAYNSKAFHHPSIAIAIHLILALPYPSPLHQHITTSYTKMGNPLSRMYTALIAPPVAEKNTKTAIRFGILGAAGIA
jgi:hypothetical protein